MKYLHRNGIGLLLILLGIMGLSVTIGTVTLSARWLMNERATQKTQTFMKGLARVISSFQLGPVSSVIRVYETDTSVLPDSLEDLVTNPGLSACATNTSTQLLTGWCGPYWTFPYQGENHFEDGWGRVMIYDKANRVIRSRGQNGIDDSGGGDDLVQIF